MIMVVTYKIKSYALDDEAIEGGGVLPLDIAGDAAGDMVKADAVLEFERENDDGC